MEWLVETTSRAERGRDELNGDMNERNTTLFSRIRREKEREVRVAVAVAVAALPPHH